MDGAWISYKCTTGRSGAVVDSGGVASASISGVRAIACSRSSVESVNVLHPLSCAGPIHAGGTNMYSTGIIGVSSQSRGVGVYWITHNDAHHSSSYDTSAALFTAYAPCVLVELRRSKLLMLLRDILSTPSEWLVYLSTR